MASTGYGVSLSLAGVFICRICSRIYHDISTLVKLDRRHFTNFTTIEHHRCPRASPKSPANSSEFAMATDPKMALTTGGARVQPWAHPSKDIAHKCI